MEINGTNQGKNLKLDAKRCKLAESNKMFKFLQIMFLSNNLQNSNLNESFSIYYFLSW